MIATYMRKQAGLNEKLFLEYDLKQSLRYGENPHQQAKFYASIEKVPYSLATAEQLNGKELSYNNIQDANAALNIVREFDCPFCVGLKHMNPCGAAIGKDVTEAWKKAFEADKVSIFGGIVATNREIDLETAQLMKPIFLEIIMAPSFSDEALELLRTKKNLRLLKVDMTKDTTPGMQYVSVNGGMLAQNQDLGIKEVTADMQMNRIGSAKIALEEAEANLKEKGVDVRTVGLVMGSDAFFPFDDCVTLAHEYGVKAIAQPGGSIRDNDSIVKADEYGISMMFTGERHFKH